MSYQCHNRAPFRETMLVQDGWTDYSWTTGEQVARWKQSAFRMAKECQYTLTELGQADKSCAGCVHKSQQGELL